MGISLAAFKPSAIFSVANVALNYSSREAPGATLLPHSQAGSFELSCVRTLVLVSQRFGRTPNTFQRRPRLKKAEPPASGWRLSIKSVRAEGPEEERL